MSIDRRDIYSFLIAVFVVTITSIIQMTNPIQEEAGTARSIYNSTSDNLAIVKTK